MDHPYGERPWTWRGFSIILFIVMCFILNLATGTLAQEIAEDSPSAGLKQDLTDKRGSTDAVNGQTPGFWEYLDLLKSSPSSERPEDAKRIQIFSLYPQSFSAAKPEAYQTAPSRSYLFALPDRHKESALVGLANVDSEEKTELKNVYQKNLNTELLLGYQWGGFGSILFGRAIQYERFGDEVGRVNDMGWRIKFIKTF